MGITRQLTNKLRHVLRAATFIIISLNFTGCVSVAPPANSQGLAMSEEPKYLIFWSAPEKARELAEKIGMKGDGKTRFLGFALPTSTYELDEAGARGYPALAQQRQAPLNGGRTHARHTAADDWREA